MFKYAKWLLLLAAILPLINFISPLWLIDLNAPQYPEGIGLHIWINKITGAHPHDLTNINMLNHYIGMKEIVPDAIPELKILPYVILFFTITGILIFFKPNWKIIASWGILFSLVGLIGLYDFYLWEYDYGHNLNPKAAIKIPGMTYQPPLIGTKQLLNMQTTSLPHLGGYALALAIMLSFYCSFLFKKNQTVTK